MYIKDITERVRISVMKNMDTDKIDETVVKNMNKVFDKMILINCKYFFFNDEMKKYDIKFKDFYPIDITFESDLEVDKKKFIDNFNYLLDILPIHALLSENNNFDRMFKLKKVFNNKI